MAAETLTCVGCSFYEYSAFEDCHFCWAEPGKAQERAGHGMPSPKACRLHPSYQPEKHGADDMKEGLRS